MMLSWVAQQQVILTFTGRPMAIAGSVQTSVTLVHGKNVDGDSVASSEMT